MMPTDVEIQVDAGKLRWLRLSRGLTQRELAERAGVSADTVVRWESSAREVHPRAPALRKLAGALGVEPSELLLKD